MTEATETAVAEIVGKLRHAATTARNDDYSKPGTKERERHVTRLDAMDAAADALTAAERDNTQLRKALREWAENPDGWNVDQVNRARALLQGEPS